MDCDHVELHSYRGRVSVAPPPPLEQTHHAAAARLVTSCLARPYKLHKGEPWPRDPPLKPRPRTVWYRTTSAPSPPPPPAAAVAAALAPQSTSPERTSASNRTRPAPDLPEFHHWRHLDPSGRSESTHPRRDVHHDASISAPSATTAPPSQGILRKRPLAVAGAWAPTSGSSALLPQISAHDGSIIGTRRTTTTAAAVSSGGSDRTTPGQKKQVRVETPRTTAARTAAATATTLLPSSSRSPRRGPTTTRTGRPTTEPAAASRRDKIVPVPRSSVRPRPSSENDGDDGGGCSAASATARPSRGIGAIERCIPPPYAHRILDPLLNPVTDAYDLNPSRQEPSAVLHSFVDPDYSHRRRCQLSEAAGTGEVAPELPLSSLATMEFLAPGRRGAWLIPISEGEGPVPPFTSPVTWPADETLPPSSRSSSSRAAKTTTTRKARSSMDGGEAPAAAPLEWTDARLVVLWIYLTILHEGRGFGNIRAQAISSGAGGSSAAGDLLKLNCDAHLALAVRGLLDRLNVTGVAKRVGVGGNSGPANEKLQRLKREGACDDDDEKWFKGRALVWVDEQSRAILTA